MGREIKRKWSVESSVKLGSRERKTADSFLLHHSGIVFEEQREKKSTGSLPNYLFLNIPSYFTFLSYALFGYFTCLCFKYFVKLLNKRNALSFLLLYRFVFLRIECEFRFLFYE